MNLAVVTFTRGLDLESHLLDRCCSSVARDLPPDAQHHIVQVDDIAQFAEARICALDLAPVVAFVDYDDQIVNSGLSIAWKVMKDTQVGVVFTDEALVTLEGSWISSREGQRTYEELTDSPWRVHHLSLVNVSHVSHLVSNIRNQAGSIDRWIRITAIESGGAMHVPSIGYLWTQHPGMMSRSSDLKRYPVGPTLTRKGLIPQASI